jgi:hypothetical protein
MLAIGDVYKENRMGPRMEPCGTPQVTVRGSDENEFKLTENVLLDR